MSHGVGACRRCLHRTPAVRRQRQRPYEAARQQPVGERRCSIAAVSGTAATRRSPSVRADKRTASFSVVSTTSRGRVARRARRCARCRRRNTDDDRGTQASRRGRRPAAARSAKNRPDARCRRPPGSRLARNRPTGSSGAQPSRLADRAGSMRKAVPTPSRSSSGHRRRAWPVDEQRVGRGGGRQRLAQPAGRQHLIAQIVRARQSAGRRRARAPDAETHRPAHEPSRRACVSASGRPRSDRPQPAPATPGSARASISGSSPA